VFAGEHAGELHLPDPSLQDWEQATNFFQGLFVLAFLAEFNQDLEVL